MNLLKFAKFRFPKPMSGTMTASEAAKKWGISVRRVRWLCQHFRVYKAMRLPNGEWSIPDRVDRPRDGRQYRYREIPSHMKKWVKRADGVLEKAKARNIRFDPEERWVYFLKGSAHHLHVIRTSRLTKTEVFQTVDGVKIKAKGRKKEHLQAVKNHILALELVREYAKKRQLVSMKFMKHLWTTLHFGDTGAHRVAYANRKGEEKLKAIVKAARKRQVHPLVRAGDILNEMFMQKPFDALNVRVGYMAANLILLNGGYPPIIINRIIFKTVVKYARTARDIKTVKILRGETKESFYAPEFRHAFINHAVINAIHYSARLGLYAI